MEEDHCSVRQLMVLLFTGLLSPAIRSLPGRTAALAGSAGWLSALFALPLALGLCWLLFRLLRGTPAGVGLGEAFWRLLGAGPGKALTAVYFVWGLLLLAVNTRLYGQRFLASSYRNGPAVLFVVALLAVVLWLARGKVTAFARAGQMFYLILMIALGAALLGGAFQIKPSNLLPLWTQDVPRAALSALPVLEVVSYGVYGGFLSGGVVAHRADRRRALVWTAAFCLLLAVLQLVILGCFGPELTRRMDTPLFMMVKGIGVAGAFEGVESVLVALWVLSDLVFLGLLVFACCAMAKTIFGLKRRETAALPVVLLTWAGTFLLFPDVATVAWWAKMVVPGGNLLLGFAVPAVVLLVGTLRGKTQGGHI